MNGIKDGFEQDVLAAGSLAGLSRREFLKLSLTASMLLGVGVQGWAAESATRDIPYRTLGRTGERISAIGLGGYHIGVPKDESEGIRIIRTAIDQGINFMDNSWDYHEGGSEL